MKKIFTAILALALALAAAATAEEKDIVRGIFEKLTAADSRYTLNKAEIAGYYPGIRYGETLEDGGFTIAISGNEEMNGTYTFTREGDYLTLTVDDGDYNGLGIASFVLQAIGEYYGGNGILLNAYVNGLSVLGMDSPYFKTENDDSARTTKISVYIAGPADMKELDRMILTDEVLSLYDYVPLTEDYISRSASLGKVSLVVNGTRNSAVMLVAEYGELDDTAWQDMISVAKALQPSGWEAFTAEYTGLEDVRTESYSVTLNADEAAVREIVDQLPEGCRFAIVKFGSEAAE